jgi:hypothetical protein
LSGPPAPDCPALVFPERNSRPSAICRRPARIRFRTPFPRGDDGPIIACGGIAGKNDGRKKSQAFGIERKKNFSPVHFSPPSLSVRSASCRPSATPSSYRDSADPRHKAAKDDAWRRWTICLPGMSCSVVHFSPRMKRDRASRLPQPVLASTHVGEELRCGSQVAATLVRLAAATFPVPPRRLCPVVPPRGIHKR